MPTPLSQNPRSGIKSSNWATYRTWHVGVIQATSPTAGGISEGLHASDVACAHLANASAIGMENQPRPACISRGVCASTGRQRPWPARISQQQATSAKACTKNRGVCTYGKQHRPTARSINQGLDAFCLGLRASDGRHHPWPDASANDRRHW